MELDRAIDYFIVTKRTENRTKATIDWYSNALFRFVKRMPGVLTVEEIDAFTIRDYIALMQGDPALRDISVNKNVRAIRAFCRWLVKEDLLRADPFDRVTVPDFEHRDVDTLADGDFRALLAACDRQTEKGKRDEAILMFLFDTGVRVGELVALKTDDLDLVARQARVVGKGRKWRVAFFSPQTALALQRYLARRRKGEWVFTGWKNRPLTVYGVNQIMRRLGMKAGITNRHNPHTFRHTYATNYLRNGGDPASLQRILGHSDISTTIRNYAHYVTKDLAEAHDRYSVMSRALARR